MYCYIGSGRFSAKSSLADIFAKQFFLLNKQLYETGWNKEQTNHS